MPHLHSYDRFGNLRWESPPMEDLDDVDYAAFGMDIERCNTPCVHPDTGGIDIIVTGRRPDETVLYGIDLSEEGPDSAAARAKMASVPFCVSWSTSFSPASYPWSPMPFSAKHGRGISPWKEKHWRRGKMMSKEMVEQRVCSPDHGRVLDNSVRRWIHPAQMILSPYVSQGDRISPSGSSGNPFEPIGVVLQGLSRLSGESVDTVVWMNP